MKVLLQSQKRERERENCDVRECTVSLTLDLDELLLIAFEILLFFREFFDSSPFSPLRLALPRNCRTHSFAPSLAEVSIDSRKRISAALSQKPKKRKPTNRKTF